MTVPSGLPARALAAALLLALAGCVSSTGSSGDVADVRGTWAYDGSQAAPALTLEGSLVISGQQADVVSGQLTWEERDAVGGTRLDGGPVSGRVIERSDVDFDVLLPGGSRRHVARLTADTMRGTWVQLSTGATGSFSAVRGGP